MSTLAALLSSTPLAVLAAIHVYWACGGRWPGHDDESLARKVVGGPAGSTMPSPTACLIVATLLLACAWVVLAAAEVVPGPFATPLLRTAAWACAAVLALRGVGGYFDRHLRPATRGSPFERLNRTVYSPLCLFLAGAVVVSVLAS